MMNCSSLFWVILNEAEVNAMLKDIKRGTMKVTKGIYI